VPIEICNAHCLIVDPEIGDIVTLGLIYGVIIARGDVRIEMIRAPFSHYVAPAPLARLRSGVAPGGSRNYMQSDQRPDTPDGTKLDAPQAGQDALAAEVAEARDLAQRAAEPDAGRQDWLAEEEVAMLAIPEHGMPMLCEVRDACIYDGARVDL
jgi:hypothetical protein